MSPLEPVPAPPPLPGTPKPSLSLPLARLAGSGGDFLRRHGRRLALLLVAGLALLGAARFVGRSLRSVAPGEAGLAVNTFTGSVRLLPPGTHLLPRLLFDLHTVRVSDRILDGAAGTFAVTSREGLPVTIGVTARWALDRSRLVEKWASLPARPEAEVVVPVLTAAFRSEATSFDAPSLAAQGREELSRRAAGPARARLLESGIVLKEVLVSELRLPEEYEEARRALVRETQAAERKDATLVLRGKEIEETRLVAEAEKVRREKASETEAAQRLIAAKAEAETMQWILPLKEKEIRQRELEGQAERARLVKQAETAAEADRIRARSDAERRRTMADAEAYAIRATSLAQFDGLKREAELIQANPVWVSKVFAERISDNVQVILTPSLSTDVFEDEVMKRLAQGRAAVAKRGVAPDADAGEGEEAPDGEGTAVPSSTTAQASPAGR